jgi:hypothetical protein
MLSMLSNPIFRKILTALICCGIGFYIGFGLKADQLKNQRKQKNIVIGKLEVVSSSFNRLQTTNDTLLSVIINLAKQERIKVDNHITDTKVKDGSQLNFVPKTRAKLTVTKLKTIDVVPTLTRLEPTMPTTPTIPTIPTEEKKRSWIRRLFTRKNR